MSTKLGTLTLDLVARVSGFTQGMNQASTSAEREMRRVENSVVTADGLIKKLAVTAGATFSVAQITNYADGYTGMVNKLKLVTNGQGQLSTAMNDTHKIAQATASDWNGVLDVYTKFQGLSKRLGIDQAEVARITETVTKTVAMSSQSAASSEAALLQFGQALNVGFLRGAELTSVLSQAPALAKALAEGMGVAVGDLKKLGEDGKITSEVMRDALLKMSSSVDAEYAKTATTIAASFNLIKNETIRAVGEFDSAIGASKKFVEGMTLVSKNMDVVTNTMVVGAAFMEGKYIPTIYASALSLSEKAASQLASMRAEQLANEITAQRTARVAHLTAVELANAEAQLARMSGMARLAYLEATVIPLRKANTAALAADTVAQNANNHSKNLGITATSRLATALMGPVGLGLAVAGVAASYLMLRDSTKDTTSTLDLQKGTVAELVAEYSKLDDLQKRTTMRELEKEVNKLSTAYTVAFSDLNAFIGWLDDSGSVSESTAKEVNRLYKEYRTGGLSASDFATAINGLSGVQVKHKQKIDDLTTAQAKSKTEYEKVKAAQDALTKQTGAAVKANNDEAESINAKRIAQEKLNAALSAKSMLEQDKNNLWIRNATASKDSWGTQWSDFVEQFKQTNSLPLDKTLDAGQLKIAQEQFVVEQKRKNLSSQITNDAKDQTKEMEAQQKLQAKQAVLLAGNNEQTRNMLRVYQAFRSTGLPDKQSRVMTAQVGRENDFVSNAMFGSHKDRNNGYTNSGFISWQKGRSTQLMQYLQSQGVLDKKGNIEQTQDALDAQARFLVQEITTGKGYGKSKTALANDDLDYRSLEKIIGQNLIGWDYTGKSGLGAEKASKHLAKQDNYHSQLSKILGSNPEIVSSSLKDISKIEDEAYKAKAKTEDDIRQLQAQFDTEAIQRSKERDEQINQATILGQMDLIPKIWERYNKQELLAAYQLEMELKGYKWSEDQKIAYRRDMSKLEYDISGKYGAEELKLRKKGLDALAQYEIDEYRKTQKLKIAEYQLAFSQPLTDLQADVLDMQAKANMGDYGSWALQNQYGKDLNSFGANYDKNVDNINEDKTITDDATRKQLLLQAEESFRQSKLALSEKYTLLEQDLIKSQHQEQLQVWGNLLGQAQNTWSQITQAVKDSNGEQSTSFKMAFAAQQMFAMGSATISALQAYNQILASPWYMDVMSKTTAANMVLGMGMANVGMIGAQAITGMAHNGIDNIPKEGTWLLDGGERVLNPQQNKDLTNYLSNKGSGGGNVEVNVQVTDSGVTSQSNQADQKQLGQMIGNAVRAVIMQEKRQGGLLSK